MSYNIPVAIWLIKEYPQHPPIAYVVPTNDMLIKASKHVDISGRCHLEYLQSWERKSEVRMALSSYYKCHCQLAQGLQPFSTAGGNARSVFKRAACLCQTEEPSNVNSRTTLCDDRKQANRCCSNNLGRKPTRGV
jgi:hypothetical protein